MNDTQYHLPINLGNPNEFTIKELAELIKKKIDTPSQVVYHNLPQDDPKQRKPCIKKAKNILNWEPNISLSIGLDKTINYFRNNKK